MRARVRIRSAQLVNTPLDLGCRTKLTTSPDTTRLPPRFDDLAEVNEDLRGVNHDDAVQSGTDLAAADFCAVSSATITARKGRSADWSRDRSPEFNRLIHMCTGIEATALRHALATVSGSATVSGGALAMASAPATSLSSSPLPAPSAQGDPP